MVWKKCIYVAVVVLMAITAYQPAMAVNFTLNDDIKVDLYGSLRFETARVSNSKETNNMTGTPGNLKAPTADDNDYTLWQMDKILSRVGARFSVGRIRANVEMRPLNGSYYRHYYAAYNSDGYGEFLIGQTWDPLELIGAAWEGMLFGGITPITNMNTLTRDEQFRWAYTAEGVGKFIVAFMRPYTGGDISGVAASKKEADIPGLRLNYSTEKIGPFKFDIFGGYNEYTITSGTDEYDVDGMVYGIRPEFTIGNLSMGVNLWAGTNPRIFANNPYYGEENVVLDPVSNDVVDVDIVAFRANIDYKFTKDAKVRLEYGLRETERDSVAGSPGFKRKVSNLTLSIPFTNVFQKKIKIMPTVEYVDWGSLEYKDSTPDLDLGETLAYGVYWQIDF